jgi:hypothetical protein
VMIKVYVEEVAGHGRAPVRMEACCADAGKADWKALRGERTGFGGQ